MCTYRANLINSRRKWISLDVLAGILQVYCIVVDRIVGCSVFISAYFRHKVTNTLSKQNLNSHTSQLYITWYCRESWVTGTIHSQGCVNIYLHLHEWNWSVVIECNNLNNDDKFICNIGVIFYSMGNFKICLPTFGLLRHYLSFIVDVWTLVSSC